MFESRLGKTIEVYIDDMVVKSKLVSEHLAATVGHPRMNFLDAFQGYHQIPLTEEDQEKTAFVTPVGNYHYKVMPFSLKNA